MSHETCPLDRYRDANNSSEVDIPVYEDDAGHLNEVGAGSEDPDSQQLPRSYYARQQSWHVESAVTLPEDEPWPGIEDDMSDGENMDPLDTDMDGSDSGSEPSEYPSTQRAWHVVDDDNMDDPGSNTGFKIHEDGIETGVRGSVTRWN
ncbi:hypothetical protein NKR23_g7683 [Pleurostoma richardsiae]|uniref:Uncharacterized protein n=1 Tax=Pleurostoma richardsiae TaxID=41990 RepID=A0AA38RKU8_9PEZI|nr:hypothetical protein NKR23_g7683 [Pleurostoma richardsiae]